MAGEVSIDRHASASIVAIDLWHDSNNIDLFEENVLYSEQDE